MKASSSPEAVGLIVPPSNPTLEDEISSLIDRSPRIHIARLPYSSTADLAVRNEIYLESYLDAARSFGTLPLRGVIIGCTGSNYRLGAVEDQRRCEAASAELGLPFMTASLAVLQMIRALGFRKIQLELPYPDWLIAQAVAYWQSAGLEVVAHHSILKKISAQDAYGINVQELEEYLLQVQPSPDTVVLLSGTGMPTLSAMADRITSYPAPLISSNLCIAQWLLGCSDLACETDLYRQLYAKLKIFSMVPEQAAADNLFNPFGNLQ
jgi:maleate isomerase